MRKTTRFCFVLLLISIAAGVFAQEVTVKISFDSAVHGTGSSSGPKRLQLRGYDLHRVISKVFDIQKNQIRIDQALLGKTVSLTIETKNSIGQTDIKPSFTRALKDQLGITIDKASEKVAVQVAYLTNEDAINTSKCRADKGVSKSITEINGQWSGVCVAMQELIDKISEWYDKTIINETLSKSSYNLSVTRTAWTDLINDLELNYGIVITEETRALEILTIHP
jgi:hypothetical protein